MDNNNDNKKYRNDESFNSNYLPSIHVWEKRTDSEKQVLNSPDMELKLRYYGHHDQIKVGRSPDRDEAGNESGSFSPQEQFDCELPPILSSGESIVFDDIEDNNWTGSRILISPIEDKSFSYLDQPRDVRPSTVQQQQPPPADNKVLQVLQIAEYEGSPRRIGNAYSQQPAVSTNSSSPIGLPKPGFPLRVLSPASENAPDTASAATTPDHNLGNVRTSAYQHEDHFQYDLDLDLEQKTRNFTLSPDTTEYDSSNCDLDSELSLKYIGAGTEYVTDSTGRLHSNSMPILEDGLSSGHASDTESNNASLSILIEQCRLKDINNTTSQFISTIQNAMQRNDSLSNSPPPPAPASYHRNSVPNYEQDSNTDDEVFEPQTTAAEVNQSDWSERDKDKPDENLDSSSDQLAKEKLIPCCDEDEADTDLETDRLLGQQRLEESSMGESKIRKHARTLRSAASAQPLPLQVNKTHTAIRHSGVGGGGGVLSNSSLNSCITTSTTITTAGSETGMTTMIVPPLEVANGASQVEIQQMQKSPDGEVLTKKVNDIKKNRSKEGLLDPTVLIEGVLFRAKYLGSTQLVCEGQPTKMTRMMQAEEAVSRIKAPEGESQPSTEVDLFISTEKIMVLNTDLKEIMMDHALRTISYIADIGELVVLMARRRFIQQPQDTPENADGKAAATSPTGEAGGTAAKANRTPKMICHIFESEEAQFIAQSIGQAFQVAYMEFLKANGIEDHSFMKEMDYQEVLNSQEIFGDELEIFAKKELQKEVVVPKAKGEILGIVIVESGWGSMLPTVVIANLASTGAAARCGQLNIGDQIIAINGLSLVGLPLSMCQTYIKNSKNQTAVKFTVVPCAPVVEVKIKRPNTKYQLGFSVQNGVICSLLRGGIAERGGIRVGHRIIEINNQSVVAVPHEKIVNLLATSVGEILMKTMPTSMFRLLTGQETPIFI